MAMELPEAVTVARQMNEVLPGKRICSADLKDCDSLIRQTFVNMHRFDVVGTTVGNVTNKGKWIFIRLDPGLWLLTALETSGQILYHRSQETVPAKYNLKLQFHDDAYLTVRIVGWGFLHVVLASELKEHFFTRNLGVSPLDEQAFSHDAFARLLAEYPGKSVKEFFLDQSRVAGIGNGYMQEILLRAKVHPRRKVSALEGAEREALFLAVRQTMDAAVASGGSEVDLFGQPGGYSKLLGLHMLGQPCPVCGTPIERLKYMGSSTYLCPSCQQA